ncbi:aminoglycoside phosphotransferase family protein [Micromonospora sp. RHAY321]|uniref:phosphotransferase family protein n=1 Tax=Micromonospora sp. RHAY321 TaxID=2944807 RepID=UPI00207C345C|nr:phosphotransferase [Micromonospora sp. RHAY321]MCO1597361.1 aminoglycoside phosphotransferase family protein [Micromonospora sp. RHAY321]
MSSPTSLPPVPYHASALRPSWSALPAALRDALADRLGAPVVTVRVAGAGFTRGFAAVLDTADGGRAFVKAAPAAEQPHLVDWYAREAAILDRLPAGLPAPRPRWTLSEAGWFVLCTDAVDGHTPQLPWVPAELDATLAGYAGVAAALADPPAGLTALGLPHLADLARSDILWWEEVAAGREPSPALPEPVRGRLPELVALESRLPRYAAGATGLIHGDLRVDNVLIGADGRAWFCDWTWVCHGPAWFDLAGLLITAYAGGLDADRLFATHPATADAPPDALDASLAALAGYYLTGAEAAPVTASPHLPAHQRWSGGHALDWLAHRQGWR